MEFSTTWLMPSDKRNWTTAKATGLILFHCLMLPQYEGCLLPYCYKATGLILFHCLMLPQYEGCLLPYCYTYNASFMDLPVHSSVSYSSLLITKSVDFVNARDGFHSQWKLSVIFIVAWLQRFFSYSCWFILLYGSQQWNTFFWDDNWYNRR